MDQQLNPGMIDRVEPQERPTFQSLGYSRILLHTKLADLQELPIQNVL